VTVHKGTAAAQARSAAPDRPGRDDPRAGVFADVFAGGVDAVAAGAILTVDLGALAANYRLLRDAAGGECGAVVKADAYGIGMGPVAAALHGEGCRHFFVGHLAEGAALRAVLPEASIYVLNGVPPGAERQADAAGLIPALNSPDQVAAWRAAARSLGRRLPGALQFDTGMTRLGLSPAAAEAAAADAAGLAEIDLRLVLSHLACADEPAHPLNARQIARFREIRELFPGLRASFANSSGVFLGADYHFDLVRPGIAVYGGAIVSGEPTPMRPVVRLEASIVQIRKVPAGETIGYGGRETTRRASRIAILSVGYADGFHRAASSADGAPGARGLLNGRSVPLIGRISMDLMAVDVTDVPEAKRGDAIELIGDTVTVQEVAARMGTIDYEVLTALGRRYARIYRGG